MQITTAAQSAQRDAGAIASGIDSWTLMHAAGQAAAQFVAELATRVEASVISVLAGSGNNGGDAYVVAAELLHNDFTVVLYATGEPRTEDAKRARDLYQTARDAAGPSVDFVASEDDVRFVLVDGVLGTGQTGELREPEREVTDRIARFRAFGGLVVALDIPTGVNATTGDIAEGAVQADYTLAFGTMKRAHVLQRGQCGEVTVLDIGLGEFADKDDGAWELGDAQELAPLVPEIRWNAHKGTRGRLAIVGGNEGMAGAVVLASQAALHSGVGLVHAHVHGASALALQISVPQAITHAWSDSGANESLAAMHAIAVGPGLGRSVQSSKTLSDLIAALPNVPLVLDADALTLLGADVEQLRALCEHREVVCTPHVGEFARLIGKPAHETLEGRIAQAHELSDAMGATILLKGTPTIIVAPHETTTTVVARGTPVLATGGSGDMLTGIVGTLLAQGVNGADAAAIGAYVHGRAAEIATENAGSIRGVTLQEVMASLAAAWREFSISKLSSTDSEIVLTQLPAL
ncbi:MAG: NAD(P)H-hydrate dehydratase [Gemmatimonadaceae bacterium]